jgi:nucleoside-diphosphate-sugar epimerase
LARLAITGAGGLIGQILGSAFAGRFDLTRIDKDAGDAVDVVADSTDLEALIEAFHGADLVVDLAADPSADAPWWSVRANNIPATLNALEAAHRAGVRRLVFASSNHVTGMYEQDEPYASIVKGAYDGLDPESIPRITAADPIRPDGPYGVGKALGEAAGRMYAELHELSVICLRIGTVNREGRPRSARTLATLLTHGDLVRLVGCALDAPPSVRFGIFYGVSGNRWRFWDIEDARARIGYEPGDDAEQFR